jgi:chromosome segregation ATPase
MTRTPEIGEFVEKLRQLGNPSDLGDANTLLLQQAATCIEALLAECDELSELNAELADSLRAARRLHESAVEQCDKLHTDAVEHKHQLEEHETQERVLLQAIRRLEEQNQALTTANKKLAHANVRASESIAQLEDRDDHLIAMNDSLAHANAHSAELICELEGQSRRLQEAMERVRVLQGLISICMHCHRIRDDGDMWSRLEEYMCRHTDVRFSHGLCPSCLEEHYGEH